MRGVQTDMSNSAHILLDVDGTILNWGDRWDSLREEVYSHFPRIPLTASQRSFNLRLGLNDEEIQAVDEMFNYPGFYRDLKPFPGAIDAYHGMVDKGYHVRFVTSPWWSNPTCLQDKSDSILEYFGEAAQSSIVFTQDKTAVRGDILIDDKPEISGSYGDPEWVQVLYDQPYNQDIPLRRIYDWSNWEEVVEETLEERRLDKLEFSSV